MAAFSTEFEQIHPSAPIFALRHAREAVIYTPGYLMPVRRPVAEALKAFWSSGGAVDPALEQKATWLVTQANSTMSSWRAWEEQEFAPECLTLYPSNACNLACRYCYSAAGLGNPRRQAGLLSLGAVEAAATLVAGNCQAKGAPFNLVLHGGGEPALHLELMQEACRITRSIASSHGLVWQSYLATNGVMDPGTASWVARNINTICLSCDGPPDVQDAHRPLLGGRPSSPILERTARLIRAAGVSVEARSTITRSTVERQVEILEYLADALGARAARFEPVYRAGPNVEAFEPQDAASFVADFLKAETRAARLGVSLSYSGVRLDELHGPYCNTLKQALNLTPDGSAVACFFHVERGVEPWSRIGGFQPGVGFVLDHSKIGEHRRRATRIPDECQGCLCLLHCARGCPDACLAAGEGNPDLSAGSSPARLFRCQVNQRLAVAWIRKAAEASLPEPKPVLKTLETSSRLTEILRRLPSGIDADAVLRASRRLEPDYRVEKHRMPQPLWARRAFNLDGESAWKQIRKQAETRLADRAISVYLHVPFCDRRCGFCDCLSQPLSPRRIDLAERFAELVCCEIAGWGEIHALRERPVTTVHWGGGTPNHLPSRLFERIVAALKSAFATRPTTEWALESTSSLLSEEHLDWLRELGFRRLHVGAQTLEDALRRRIGRRENRATLTRRLELAVSKGFVTSVDLIYGLPGESPESWVDGLRAMIALGVHGVSLYQLNVSNRNRRFLKSCGLDQPDDLLNYVLFQAAEQLLMRAGYRKAFFNHYARPEDLYLYYGYAERGEDLIAIGPSADGAIGGLLFRHHDLEGYLESASPGLEGGLTRSTAEERLAVVEVALMSGRLPASLAASLGSLGQGWLLASLIAPRADSGDYILTANGSWFIARMLEEATARLIG